MPVSACDHADRREQQIAGRIQHINPEAVPRRR